MRAIKPKKWETPYLEDIHMKGLAGIYSFRKLNAIINISPTGKERAIDIGCGQGYFLLTLAKYNKEAIGLDRKVKLGMIEENVSYADGKWKEQVKGKTLLEVTKEMIETELGKENNVKIIEGDAKKIPLKDESVDTAYMLDVLEHIPEREKAIKEVKRILKKDGTLIISVPDMDNKLLRTLSTRGRGMVESDDHAKFRWKELVEEMKKEFTIEEIKKYPSRIISMSIIIKARK
ncbi:MAG: methyltransferase domain-containing protein [archaeon]